MFIRPTSDIFVKYLLGSEKNKDLLLSFVNAVITDSHFNRIISVEIKNPFNIKDCPVDKESILDVKATDETGRQYDIEVQSVGDESFKIRSLYYWAELYSSQLFEGDIYSRLKPAVCINLLNFTLFQEFDYFHSCFLLREINNPEYILTDHLILHFLELPKLNDEVKDDHLIRWLLYFKNEGTGEDIMQILIKDDETIAKAHKEYEHFTQNEQLRDLYESRLKWEKDYNSAIFAAKQEGIKEGIKEGKDEGIKLGELQEKHNVLALLLSKKFGLSDDEEELIKSINNYEKLDKAISGILFAETKDKILSILKQD
ncbi:MAG: Rpn family recombination-promoting nuclease/putative transposase [Spirochaetota bacterium]|nr:Rpn family recombination-promoting nuclease/putative transposase [Spirochaetota bacterium]